ncbi:hypothetical protein LLAPH_532_0035 [Lactococcus phage ASCC532]|uniref:DUF7336 domain-containing protein n=1 Tax=Lactococcus phage ASCC532 TaxID=2892351 RepID=H9EHC7_9CAUD|nr:hypothetical protein LLAPH_532_0035 [Lactococcus phage ASCC532]AFE88094.1 hypothetical protein LLAPH_532_0035 [Lactococcus phage ASCC532]
MKVYVLTADTDDGSWCIRIVLFGVFSTKEKAEKRASELKLKYHNITVVNIDEVEESINLGEFYK